MINPHLLNQAAQGTPAPLASFVPAFNQGMENKMRRDMVQDERDARLAETKLKWTQYVQEQQATQQEQDNRAQFEQEFGALDPKSPTYGRDAARLATMYGQDLEGASLMGSQQSQQPKLVTFQTTGGKMVQAMEGTPEHAALVADPEAIMRSTPGATDFGDKGKDGTVWAAYKKPGSETVEFGRFTDSQILAMKESGGQVMPVGQAPEDVAKFLGGDKTKKELADKFVETQALVRTGQQILDVVKESPESVGWAGNAVGLGYTLMENANRLIGLASPDTPKDKFLKDNIGVFEGAALGNAELQSLIYDVAYSYMAAVKGQSGRGLSDQDLKNGLRIIVASTPAGISQNIRRALEEAVNVYQDKFRALSGRGYGGEFGELERFRVPGQSDEQTMDEKVTQDKIMHYDPETGTLE